MAMSGAMSAHPMGIYDALGNEREVAKEEREQGERKKKKRTKKSKAISLAFARPASI
jgi:hypothetical protein